MLQKILLGLCLFVGLSACTTDTVPVSDASKPQTNTLQSMRLFKQKHAPVSVQRSNQDIAAEFLELTFQLELGTKLNRFTRYNGPISVAFYQTPNLPASHDLDQLIYRLRTEALIDIHRAPDNTHANINIEFVPLKKMNTVAPGAACFVIPNAKTWAHFNNTKQAINHRWTHIPTRVQATVYIPLGSPPQEVRDCMHEEILQALGPLNDLYRLSDSIFNDDNFQTAATSYDMLILRAYYSPYLRNGMSKSEVSGRILGILNSLNPAGAGIAPRHPPKTSTAWKEAVVASLGVGSSSNDRKRSSNQMVTLSETGGYNDVRLGFSYYSRGRVLERIRPSDAEQMFNRAYNTFSTLTVDGGLHRAHVAMKLARFALSRDDAPRAVEWADSGLASARDGQNAIVLFTLLALKAKAYRLTDRTTEATDLIKEAQSWGLYAYGSIEAVNTRLARIARLGERY